ncbi:putative transcriptional regulator, AsnC family [Candidatus Nitrososphaera gargensis Ga9.2]|uniref:Putative transcriptional regulator, AsnC family n=1 Tax=Nitrososphaera gargensis (strain Ga9.2) TaxID=1237085 RepID=K0IHE5_NITGG|nr:Lrp/AsnC family transcriptional regulator [Candidatus Nitrososphaera gargensis]AFU57192.1 putative transcriptional regulator, AsnC family [Candidatus Nitrososphaera gargensis Ga9.2]
MYNELMVSAFVLVNCHFPFDVKIADEVSKLPFVSNVYRTEGRYDLLIKLNADTEDKLKERISGDINTIHGIDATITLTIA